jgi:hypothetical protein
LKEKQVDIIKKKMKGPESLTVPHKRDPGFVRLDGIPILPEA